MSAPPSGGQVPPADAASAPSALPALKHTAAKTNLRRFAEKMLKGADIDGRGSRGFDFGTLSRTDFLRASFAALMQTLEGQSEQPSDGAGKAPATPGSQDWHDGIHLPHLQKLTSSSDARARRKLLRGLAIHMQVVEEIVAAQAATIAQLVRQVQALSAPVQANASLLQAISSPVQASTAQGGKPQDCPLVAFGEGQGNPAAAFRRLWTRAVLEGGVGVFGGGTLDAVKAMVERQESGLPGWMGALGLEAPLQGVYEGEHSAVWAAVQAAVASVREGIGGYAAGQKRMRARVRKFMDNATGIVGIQKEVGGDAVSRSASGRRGVDHCIQVLKESDEKDDWIAWYKPKRARGGKESFAKADIEALHAANFAAIGVLGDGQDPPQLEDLLLASLRDAASGTSESKADKLYRFVQVGYNAAVGPNPWDSGWGDLTPPDLSKGHFHTLSWAHLQLLLPFIALAWLDARRESLREGRLEWLVSRMTSVRSATEHEALMARLRVTAAPPRGFSDKAACAGPAVPVGGQRRRRGGWELQSTRRRSVPRPASFDLSGEAVKADTPSG